MAFFTVLISRFSLSLYAHVKLLGATRALKCKFCTFPDSTQVSAPLLGREILLDFVASREHTNLGFKL